MKLVRSLAIAALVAVPVLSFAQSSQPVTRAEVKAELVQLQKAGYRESSDYTQYPAHLQTTLEQSGPTRFSGDILTTIPRDIHLGDPSVLARPKSKPPAKR